ncbi:hypothetical protein ACFYTQ_34060 [Nocardia sp. NPDC004068]|uniref:hypothetical protein n=1 Tax=Nocardia sp. NPDC004068 TaxID=3364303 RepID=UPI0036C5432D
MLIRKFATYAASLAATGAILCGATVDAWAAPLDASPTSNTLASSVFDDHKTSVGAEPRFIDAPPPELFSSKEACENWITWREFTHPWEVGQWRCTEVGPNGVTSLYNRA